MFNDTSFREGENCRRQLHQLGAHRRAGGLLLHRRVSLGAPDRKVSFTVPTGNFAADIFAGYVAKRMGLPIDSW